MNNPVNLVDPDGNAPHIPGTDGKPISYTMVGGEIAWSPNTSDDVMRIGNSLLKTQTGKTQLDKAITSANNINVSISSETVKVKSKDGEGYELGNTDFIGESYKSIGNGEVELTGLDIDVTIYEGSVPCAGACGLPLSIGCAGDGSTSKTLPWGYPHLVGPRPLSRLSHL